MELFVPLLRKESPYPEARRQIAEGCAASFGMEVDIMLKQGGYLHCGK